MAILPGHLQALLPEPSELRLERVERTSNLILVLVKAARQRAAARTVEHLLTEFIASTSARSAVCLGTARQFGCALWLEDFIAVRRTAAERFLPSALPEWCAGTADQPNVKSTTAFCCLSPIAAVVPGFGYTAYP